MEHDYGSSENPSTIPGPSSSNFLEHKVESKHMHAWMYNNCTLILEPPWNKFQWIKSKVRVLCTEGGRGEASPPPQTISES